jgi:hypothetical protein
MLGNVLFSELFFTQQRSRLMTNVHQIIFYPVGNGDTVQLVLHGGRRVLFDFCHRQKAEDPDTPEIDLKGCLREDLKKAGRDNYDVVAFTHADVDHIQGSTEFFELGHASKYQGGGRIKITELWVPAAMLLESATQDQQSNEFVILRQEARHRLLEGKGIRVFSKPVALMDWLTPRLRERGEPATARDHLFVDAGTIVPGFSLAEDGTEFFCHSPFIKHCDDGDIIRNTAALVFNVRMRADGRDFDFLQVGDATWEDLEDIVRTTRMHGNHDRLGWNLYNLPHHCSYLALGDDKGQKETVLAPLVEELLLQGKKDAYMVSCSSPVTDVKESYLQVQPPHIQARNAYERHLSEIGGRKFLVTMEEPNASKPEPLVFEVTFGGIAWKRSSSVGAPAILLSKPPRAG